MSTLPGVALMRPARYPYRILVTGSRTWTDGLVIENALHEAYFAAQTVPGWATPVTVVHGKCPTGADSIADRVTCEMKEAGLAVEVESHPAKWNRGYGKSAGYIRNMEMVKLGADVCLAFIKDNSPGASHCTALAEKAGISVRRFIAQPGHAAASTTTKANTGSHSDD